MERTRISLQPDEEVLFEKGPAILTNQRLVAEAMGIEETVEVLLGDLVSFKLFNVGQQSRLNPGLQATAGGTVALVLGTLARSASELLEGILFVVGALVLLLGVYYLLTTAVRIRPRTTVLFETSLVTEVGLSFPDWDNVDAKELTRTFARAKRAL
jgi:hypothetical protein